MNHTPTSDPASGTTTAKIADTASRNAALALAFALPGDTLLYLLLPIYAASFGVTLPEAGLLLAANRLIRIVAYGWVARLYSRLGPRTICTVAAASAVASTLIFAAFTGVWLLLVGRLLWGLSYAAMNVANQASHDEPADRRPADASHRAECRLPGVRCRGPYGTVLRATYPAAP